jgi:8-oxo-dGTP diphosphatase
VPGGARDSHETPIEAALREAAEELGLDPTLVTIFGDHAEDHTTWRYDTILATADRTALSLVHNRETTDAQWFTFDEIEQQPLHHAFAAAWPLLRARIDAHLA